MTGKQSPGASLSPHVRLVVWITFVGSVFLYGGIAFVLGASVSGAGERLFPGWVFPLLGLAAVWLAFFVNRRMEETASPRSATPEALQEALRRSIILWAIDETVAVFGFVSVFLGAPPTEFVAYGVVSLLLLFRHRPR